MTKSSFLNNYAPLAPLLLCWTTVCILLFPSSYSLWELWAIQDAGYSHGVLIVGMIFYLLAIKKEQILASLDKQQPSYLAMPLIFIGALVWAAGYLMDIQLLQWLTLPGLLTLCTWQLFGFRAALVSAPIPLFLYLGIPIWDYLNSMLQQISVWATTILLKVFQIPAKIEGIDVIIPYGQFRIADGCSGLRYFLVSLTLSLFYGYAYYSMPSLKETLIRRTLLVAGAVLIGTAFNWVRIFLIIYLGYKTKMETSLVEDHEMFGWVLFAVALIPILYLAQLFSPDPTKEPIPSTDSDASIEREPDIASSSASGNGPSTAVWPKAIPGLIALLALSPTLGALLSLNMITMKQPEHYPAHLPFDIGNWSRTSAPKSSSRQANSIYDKWSPEYINTDQTSDIYYRNSETGNKIRLSLRIYFTQKQEAELIFYHNESYDDSLFQALHSEKVLFKDTEMRKTRLSYRGRQLQNQQAPRKDLLLYELYYVAGAITSNRLEAKALQLKSLLQGRNDGAYIAIALDCYRDPNKGECQTNRDQEIIEFLTTFFELGVLPFSK